jgi:NAD(P)-dependent dehydrogenase (short-subunit alcohol dehydrogenase family)
MSTTTTAPEQLHKPPFPNQKMPPPGTEAEMRPRPDHGEETYRGSGKLSGKRALITGGDSGIGRAVALAFAREGADVAISYCCEHKDAKETERLVRDAGTKSLLLPGDIGEADACEELARRVISEFGGVDILVNNAAYQRTYASFEEIPEDEFEEAFRVNVFAMFRLCRELLPRMSEGGAIINTTSIQAFVPSESLVPYAATKAAIASFTRSFAACAIKRGVRVNAVAPGPVWTPLIPSTMPAEEVRSFGANTIFDRPAQPGEIAPVYVFLASEEASYVAGEIYGVTGGRMPL